MRIMRSSSLALVLLPLATAATLGAEKKPAKPAAAPAEQTLSFPAQVEQVVVDVVVTDKKMQSVRGLKQEDMTVLEDGVPQTVVSFEAIQLPDLPASAAPPPRPRVSVNSSPTEQRGRTFAIVFDDTHLTPWRARQAKAAVADFLEKGVREGDRVTLVSTAGGMWWTARMTNGRTALLDSLKRLDGRYIPDTQPDRMSAYEAMRIHEYHDTTIAERVLRRWDTMGVTTLSQSQRSSQPTDNTADDAELTGRATEVYQEAVTRIRTTLDMLERVVTGLASAKGRKSVILVSEGFIEDYNLPDYKRVNTASRRANAAIYFVNARGLDAMPEGMSAQFGPALPDQDMGGYFAEALDAVRGADGVADDSGGFVVHNMNDLNKGIQRIANETQAYYLLGYIPTNTARDGKFRKIEVKLSPAKKKGLEVRARKGYYAPSDDTKPTPDQKRGVDPVFQAALDSPWVQDGIPLRMTDYVGDEKMMGKSAVRLAAELDPRSILFEEKDGRSLADLDLLMVVAHRQTGEYFRYDQSFNLKLLPSTRERLTRLWMPIVRDFELAAGDYQAKVIVRDKRSGRVGSLTHEFEVPTPDQFRTSTPVLSDTRTSTPSEEGVPGGIVTPLARREFATGSQLFCQFEVYGAKKDEKTGMPRVLQGYVVKRPDGSVVAAMAPNMIKPTSLGHLSRVVGFRLVDAPPGEYDLMMTVRDELSGKTIERHEPFTVVPAFGFAPATEPTGGSPETAVKPAVRNEPAPAAAPAAAPATPATAPAAAPADAAPAPKPEPAPKSEPAAAPPSPDPAVKTGGGS
jgi:VWFA-related protein